MSFGADNNFGSDPKVVYDAGSDRWYMVLMAWMIPLLTRVSPGPLVL